MSKTETMASADSEKGSKKSHIIIVGAGIIGVCTAYYIVHHPKFDPALHHITLLESKRVAGGASGKAGGLLALWAFPRQIVPLSFGLHEELAAKYNGPHVWDYRRLSTVSLEGDLSQLTAEDGNNPSRNELPTPVAPTPMQTSNPLPKDTSGEKRPISPNVAQPPVKKPVTNAISHSTKESPLPSDLNWIDDLLISNCTNLGGTDTTAQVHPYKFTAFLLKTAIEDSKGALDFVIGKVSKITYSMESGSATGVEYRPSGAKVNVASQEPIVLNADKVVLTVGPWTSKILPDCPILGLRAHSITVAPHTNQVLPYAIFTEFKTGPGTYISPEIYARLDEVYVCGEGDSAVDIPETTDDVEVVKERCDLLFQQVSKVSPNLARGRILKRQACYLPVVDVPSSSGPLIGETNVENLFLALGHSCWGINNAPGTGKIMSEILLDGEVSSADISGLDPSLYFDASVLVGDS